MEVVKVGGVKVTQDVLDQACQWLVSHGCAHIPEAYSPSLDLFGPCQGCTVTAPEEFVYMLFENPEIAPREFRAAFVDPPKQVRLTPAVGILMAAGFPTLVATGAVMQRQPMIPELDSWCSEYRGPHTPWVWVKGDAELDRTRALAYAAVRAAHAMDLGRAPMGDILYQRAYDLCEYINSHDRYGEQSKRNAMQRPMTCSLLILDGIGEERIGKNELETLSQVVAARWRDALPTILASDMGLSAWVARYGRIDREKARDMASKIVNALCGFAQGMSKEETERAVNSHVIGLVTPPKRG